MLGKIKGTIHVIEFQKRGLPHAHILLICDDRDKPRTVEDFDRIAQAEVPDPNRNPHLFGTITTSQLQWNCSYVRQRIRIK